MRLMLVLLLCCVVVSVAAQETPTPASTPTATPNADIPMPLSVDGEQYDGSITLQVSVGDVVLSTLLFGVLLSIWVLIGITVFFVFGLRGDKWR